MQFTLIQAPAQGRTGLFRKGDSHLDIAMQACMTQAIDFEIRHADLTVEQVWEFFTGQVSADMVSAVAADVWDALTDERDANPLREVTTDTLPATGDTGDVAGDPADTADAALDADAATEGGSPEPVDPAHRLAADGVSQPGLGA